MSGDAYREVFSNLPTPWLAEMLHGTNRLSRCPDLPCIIWRIPYSLNTQERDASHRNPCPPNTQEKTLHIGIPCPPNTQERDASHRNPLSPKHAREGRFTSESLSPKTRKKRTLQCEASLSLNPAMTYSPGPFPAKYHQRAEA